MVYINVSMLMPKELWVSQLECNTLGPPDNPVKTSHSNAGAASITGREAKIPCLMAKKPRHKTEAMLQKFNKNL